MGDIVAASGTKVYIGPQVTEAQADSVAEFAALTWTEIGLVENAGEFGDEASLITGQAVGDGRVRKAKGARDAGEMSLVCFHDALDVGQQALAAAEGNNNNYAFKVVIPDGPSDDYSDSTYYFRALVRGKRKNVGTNDNIIRNTFPIAINSAIFSVESDRQTIA